jgi:hypothetical protein
MSVFESRQTTAQLRRLQLILVAMILWDVLAIITSLSFGGPLAEIDGDRIGGFLAARLTFSGAVFVPIVMYLYALARNPLRHRGVIWAGVVEQGAAALFAVYHVAVKDINVEGAVVPLVVALVFLVALLINMPRAYTQAPT